MLLRLPTSMAILLNTIVKYHVATEPQRALPNSELRDVMLVAGSISTTGFGKRFTPGHFSLESRPTHQQIKDTGQEAASFRH